MLAIPNMLTSASAYLHRKKERLERLKELRDKIERTSSEVYSIIID